MEDWFIFDVDKLLPGDIILTRDDKDFSMKIQKWQGCRYSHAIFYAGFSTTAEATSDGVSIGNIARLLFASPENACVLRLRPSYFNWKIVMEASRIAKNWEGDQYSTRDALSVVGKSEPENHHNRQFCSKLVATSYRDAGLSIVDNPDLCSIKDILESTFLEITDVVPRLATDSELEFANSPSVLQDQDEIRGELLKEVRQITGEDIQTIEQLIEFMRYHPEHDSIITHMVSESGYLSLWKLDEEYNTWLYSEEKFVEHYGENAAKEARKILNDYSKKVSLVCMLATLQDYRDETEMDFFKMFVDLYILLIGQDERRRMMAKRVIEGCDADRPQHNDLEDELPF